MDLLAEEFLDYVVVLVGSLYVFARRAESADRASASLGELYFHALGGVFQFSLALVF